MGLLTILYRDDALVAIDKPSGLLVHRTRIARDHVVALQLLRDQVGQFVYPIHRLDRATSGVLVFGLTPQAASKLGEQFAGKSVEKEYLAVVRGWTEERGTIDHPVRDHEDSAAQPSVTLYERLATAELPVAVPPNPSARYSLVRAMPVTGRMHQIRKHFKHLAHPIIGDTRYGNTRHNVLFRERFSCYRLLLHCRRLSLTHPVTATPLTLEAPVPADMMGALEGLGVTPGMGQP